MGKSGKKIPINSVGKIIKEARQKQGLTEEELVWKINQPKITKKLIQAWEKGQEFPDLDNIYLLSEHLNLDPNELFNNRLRIQDESIHEVNWAERRLSEKVVQVLKWIVKMGVKWIGAILIIIVAVYLKQFIELMQGDPNGEQEKLVVQVIDNAINEYVVQEPTTEAQVVNNTINTNTIQK